MGCLRTTTREGDRVMRTQIQSSTKDFIGSSEYEHVPSNFSERKKYNSLEKVHPSFDVAIDLTYMKDIIEKTEIHIFQKDTITVLINTIIVNQLAITE
ncbi:hypothetical protein QJS04_geneDACA010995 [Acorus gramineus]|uniref:Uncharacterized protein n=1 Tax=Acorus gramineus TaxID=55184 RepID=A0AAV9BLI7_ACOGR|nr:hypothetical protein QJS04_geneDACA010995 [Acorus gramineus]